jgi:hypothetical protein
MMTVGRLEDGDFDHAGNASRLVSLRESFVVDETSKEDVACEAESQCPEELLLGGSRSSPLILCSSCSRGGGGLDDLHHVNFVPLTPMTELPQMKQHIVRISNLTCFGGRKLLSRRLRVFVMFHRVWFSDLQD